MAKFIIADNQDLTRHTLESLIREYGLHSDQRAVYKADLLDMLKKDENVTVVIDHVFFSCIDEEQLFDLSRRFPHTAWILLSNELSPTFLRKVIYTSHSFSIVFKDGTLGDLRDALQYADRGERFICQRAIEMVLTQQKEEERLEVLTATEIEILQAVARGKTTKEIANERFSSIHTITTHRKNIFRKLGVNTAHEAVKYALRTGWVDPSEFYIKAHA